MNCKLFDFHFKKLLIIALPLMLSSLSSMGMLFVDRVILAHLALDVHNAAVEATNVGWMFLSSWSALSGVTQILVARSVGAGMRHVLGHPVWQMIWLAISSLFLFIPLAFFGPTLFFGDGASSEMQRSYLFWMLLFGPLHGLFSALSGFFIGQGNTKITTFTVAFGNILNCILCWIFVFGWEPFVPAFGIKGAAIATNLAILTQLMILFAVFFKKSHRQFFGTAVWKWNTSLTKQCFIIGLPLAFFCLLEAAGWSCFYKMMVKLGPNHITIAGIIQNILILFNFFGEALFRSVSTLSGNAFGGKRSEEVFKIVRSGFVLISCFAVVFGGTLWLLHPMIIWWFFDDSQAFLIPALLFGLANAVIYKSLEAVRLVISGALNAAFDSFFLLIGGSCSIWLFMVLPIYFCVLKTQGSIQTALALCSLYTLLAASLYLWRFYSRTWEKGS